MKSPHEKALGHKIGTLKGNRARAKEAVRALDKKFGIDPNKTRAERYREYKASKR